MASSKLTRRTIEPSPEPPPRSARFGARGFAIAALVVAPWLFVAYLYRQAEEPKASPAPPAATSGVVVGAPGDWGQLETAPIAISPPLEYIPDDPDKAPPRARWCFPEVTPETLARWLAEAGFPPEDLERTMATARPEPRVAGVAVEVEPATVRKLSPDARARIYIRLAVTALNPRQQNAARFYGSADEWFHKPPFSPRTLEILRPLVYSHEGFQYFADIDLVYAEVADPQERRRLAKRLLREKTLLVKLRIPDAARLDSIVQYWGRGGRMTDIRPILESVAEMGPDASVDVVHLLPAFARRHLYRYPQVTLADFDKPGLANCFWTAMNFYNRRPFDDRFLDVNYAVAALKRDYYLVHDRQQLGDVVMFSTYDGQFYHAAVHVADGIVFGKNGSSFLAPWTLLPLDRVKGYFPQHAPGGRVSFYRRNGL